MKPFIQLLGVFSLLAGLVLAALSYNQPAHGPDPYNSFAVVSFVAFIGLFLIADEL